MTCSPNYSSIAHDKIIVEIVMQNFKNAIFFLNGNKIYLCLKYRKWRRYKEKFRVDVSCQHVTAVQLALIIINGLIIASDTFQSKFIYKYIIKLKI